MGVITYDFSELRQPVADGAAELSGFVKKSRAKALATTYAYTIEPASATRVRATYGRTCDDATQTVDPRLAFELPTRARFTDITWKICFSARGISEESADIEITDDATTATMQIAAGGGTRVL
jgi:hypothetical protein